MERTIQFPESRVVETERLCLRPLVAGDTAAYFSLCSDPIVMRTWGTRPHRSEADTRALLAFLDDSFQQRLSIRWGIEENRSGRLVGDIGYWRFVKERFRAEVGAKLATDRWGQGYVTEALIAVVAFGFEQMGLHSIEANVDVKNGAALRLAEKAGFEREGLLREHSYDWETSTFVDTVLLSAIKTRWKPPSR